MSISIGLRESCKRQRVQNPVQNAHASTGMAMNSKTLETKTPLKMQGYSLPITSIHKQVLRPAGLEPATSGLGNRCSIQLSYERGWSDHPRRLPAGQGDDAVDGSVVRCFDCVLLLGKREEFRKDVPRWRW
jgi:hypothetical protein